MGWMGGRSGEDGVDRGSHVIQRLSPLDDYDHEDNNSNNNNFLFLFLFFGIWEKGTGAI